MASLAASTSQAAQACAGPRGSVARTPPIPNHKFAPRRRHFCRAEKDDAPGADPRKTMLTSDDEAVMSKEEIQRLAEMRREQQRAQSNIVQGALEEAQLITWPAPKKAFFDTILVLAIVTASGTLLFGLNVLLAEGSEFWYSR